MGGGYQFFSSIFQIAWESEVTCTVKTTFKFIKSTFLVLACLLSHFINRTLSLCIQPLIKKNKILEEYHFLHKILTLSKSIGEEEKSKKDQEFKFAVWNEIAWFFMMNLWIF